MSVDTLNEAINALGPVGVCLPKSEADRILSSYENQVNAALHEMSERDQQIAEDSVSKSFKLRQRLPEKLCRPSKDFNEVVYMVSELWSAVENTTASMTIVKAAYNEAIDVAKDKVVDAVKGVGDSLANIGNFTITLAKYAPYIVVLVVGFILYRQYRKVA